MSTNLATVTPADQPRWSPIALAPIQDGDGYAQVAEHLKRVKAFQTRVEDFFRPHKQRLTAAHKALCDDERSALAPALADERACKDALVAYDREQERIRREEEKRLAEEARKQAEQEALDRAAALEREGNEYGDTGMVREAQQLVEEALQAPPPPVAPVMKATPKVQGIAFKTMYRAVVTDPAALIRYVAANPQYANLLSVNTTALNSLARSLKANLRMPGVRVEEVRDVSAGR